jgi:phage shock protein A
MSVFRKMVTLLRSSARELGESVIDANATQIYEQEVLDAKRSIEAARSDLTGVMAKEMQTARRIEHLKGEVSRFELLAVEALDKQQEPLAEEVAGKVAALEQELADESQAHAGYALQVARLKDLIKTAEARVREHERQVAMARTTESVYRATQSISSSLGNGGSRLVTARESLERIKQRHEDLADRMTAAETLDKEFGHEALERKLAAAGIGASADRKQAVMARIRARQASQGGGAAE